MQAFALPPKKHRGFYGDGPRATLALYYVVRK